MLEILICCWTQNIFYLALSSLLVRYRSFLGNVAIVPVSKYQHSQVIAATLFCSLTVKIKMTFSLRHGTSGDSTRAGPNRFCSLLLHKSLTWLTTWTCALADCWSVLLLYVIGYLLFYRLSLQGTRFKCQWLTLIGVCWNWRSNTVTFSLSGFLIQQLSFAVTRWIILQIKILIFAEMVKNGREGHLRWKKDRSDFQALKRTVVKEGDLYAGRPDTYVMILLVKVTYKPSSLLKKY